MQQEPTTLEPSLKRNVNGKIIKCFITDAALQAKNGSLGPNTLYDEFIRRNSSRDIYNLLAEYLPDCNTNQQIQIIKKLVSRLCQHTHTNIIHNIDTQLDLLYGIMNKKLPSNEYIRHMIKQSSRFAVLKAVFSRLSQNDLASFGKLSVTLFAILETSTPMRMSIKLILAFIREQIKSSDVETNTSSTLSIDLCASLFFRFTLRMQQSYGSFFIDEIVRELTIADNEEQKVDIDSCIANISFSCKGVITTLHFFIKRILKSHNNNIAGTTKIVWADYLSLCSCLCKNINDATSQSETILKYLICLNETPDMISTMHEQFMTLTSRSSSLVRPSLSYLETICWSVRACTIVYGHDYRLFALFSSALEALCRKLGTNTQTFPVQWVRPVCFLLNSFLQIASLSDQFRDQVHNFVEKRGTSILEACLFPKSVYPAHSYIYFTTTFQNLFLLFPEILLNTFLLILKHRQTHNLEATRTLLFIIILSLRQIYSTKSRALSKFILLQLLQSLEQLTLMVHQVDYEFFLLLQDLHQSIIALAKLAPDIPSMLVTDFILPKFKHYLCSSEFTQYLGPLCIYARLLVELKGSVCESIDSINELFERAFVHTSSQFQLLRPDTDALYFTIVCDLLVNVINSDITFSYTQIRPLVSFLPTICSQCHECMISNQIKADKRDVSNYIKPMYKVVEIICYQSHRYLSTSGSHSSLAECIGPDVLSCLRLIPDVLEHVNIYEIEQSVAGVLAQASRVCSPHDLFRILFNSEGSVSRSTRLVLCRSAALIILTAGAGIILPSLIVQYGAIPDRAVKLSILRATSYSFDKLSLANTDMIPVNSSEDKCEIRCTTYMALLEGTVGIVSHALAERDGSIRLMGMRVAASMMLSCVPIQQGSPLIDHLISMSFPNILDLCDRTLSDAFQRLFEALYYRFGAGKASSFLFAGLFHVAHRVRQAYKLIYDSARLYNGLSLDLFAPNMDELLTPIPACLRSSSTSHPSKSSVSVLEWVVGRKQHIDYDCKELFIRI